MRKNSKQTHSRGYSTSTAEDHQGDEKQGKTGKLSWTRGDHGDVTTNAMWCPGLDPRTEKTHKKQTNKQTQVFFSSPCVSLLCVSFIRPLLLDLSPNQIIQNNLILKSLISLYQQRPFLEGAFQIPQTLEGCYLTEKPKFFSRTDNWHL